MITPLPLLQNVRVASPCDASWEDMQAVEGDRVHFCMGCQKNVYNLSAMSQSEAEGLLRRHEGRLCVRYYQRQDGTVLTSDCPIGARAVGMSLIRRSTVAAGMFAMLFGAMAVMNTNQAQPKKPQILGGMPKVAVPVETPPVIQGDVAPVPEPTPPVMGKMKMPEPKVRPTMGIVAPEPRPVPDLHVTVGQMVRPSHGTDEIDFDQTKPKTLPSEKDVTDEAILRLQDQHTER